MKNIVLTLQVSETVFEAIHELITAPNFELSKNGNICLTANVEMQNVSEDKHRVAAIDLCKLAINQNQI